MGNDKDAAKTASPAARNASTDKDADAAQNAKAAGKAGDKPVVIEELTEEDQVLVDTLKMLVERLQESNAELHRQALVALKDQIRSSTATMASIPKAMKFLQPHYETLFDVYQILKGSVEKAMLADIISVLGMAYGRENARETLKYRLLGERGVIGEWGHEYVKHLAMEIGVEYKDQTGMEMGSDLSLLIDAIVRFFLDHNAEPDAVDLLISTEQLPRIVAALQPTDDHERVCRYILSCVPFEAFPDDTVLLKTAHAVYRSRGEFPEALNIAIRMNSLEMITEDFEACGDVVVKKQLAFMLARQRVPVDVADEELQRIANNTILSRQFQNLARELDIVEPKVPEDIYKSHLQDSLRVPVKMDTARQNLATAFVNAFVNVAFCRDKLMNVGAAEAGDAVEESVSWIYKTKESGLISAVASIGALNLWNVDQGLSELDKYLESENVFIKSGALLGIGLLHTNIRNESDPAWALLREHLASDDERVRSSALLGLALAYGGSGRMDIAETLLPLIGDGSVVVASMAALALGHVFVGTCEGEVASCIIQTMMERDALDLNKPQARFLALGLALLFTGKHEAADAIIETLRCIEHPIGRDAIVLVQACAYAASGNVLKIQEMLQLCTAQAAGTAAGVAGDAEDKEQKDGTDDDQGHLSYAALGVALISIAEDIGQEMALRIFSHLMYYGNGSVRKAVPLALGILYASHPTVTVMDILSKYSHDHDKAVAVNAVLAMGIVGAGTNHAKLAQMLRQLSSYYQKDAECLFMVRIAQGLVHLGKGTMSVSPLYSQRAILSPTGLAGLLTVLVAATDAQHLLLDMSMNGGSAHLLYFIIAAMYPRFLYCLDADSLESLPVLVRVGQAVEVVGQAGKPKTITGFQTHTAPVLIAHGERAELATEQYTVVSPILEGFVLVRKNANWQQ